MDNEELKSALLSGDPVVWKSADGTEIEYKCVSAIVYRRKNGRVDVSTELLDKCGRSVTICDPRRVRLKGGGADGL